MAHVLRHHRLRALALERARVLAVLRMVLTGEEGTEEPAPRLELSTAIGAAQLRDLGEVVRRRDESWRVDLVERLLKGFVELAQDALPLQLSALDLVQLLLHLRREAHVEDVRELLDHDLLDGLTELRREEAALLELDVAAVGEHRDDRCVRRRTTNAEPLELLHETCLGKTGRRLGEVLRRRDALAGDVLPHRDDWQRLLVLERLVVPFLVAFAIEHEVALELHDRARRAEQVATPADIGLCRRRDVKVDGGRVEDRRRHLGRHEALPDELIKFELIRREVTLDELRPARRIGGTDALVRVLRVLFVRAVELWTRGEELLAEERAQVVARLTGGDLRDTSRVRSHISDETDRAFITYLNTLIEILGHAHRSLGAERELLRGFLLQRRRRERRGRILPALASLHVGDREGLLPLQVS